MMVEGDESIEKDMFEKDHRSPQKMMGMEESKGRNMKPGATTDNFANAHQRSAWKDEKKNHVEAKFQSDPNPVMVLLFGFIFKCKLITPFTTFHPKLNRASRGFITTLTLFTIWAFTGIVGLALGGLKGPIVLAVSIILGFPVARSVQTIYEQLLFRQINNNIIKALQYVAGVILLASFHVLIIIETIFMKDDVFKHWIGVVIICFILELIVWELSSGLVQSIITICLQKAKHPLTQTQILSGKIVTPPVMTRGAPNTPV